jgi:hypothetical protein
MLRQQLDAGNTCLAINAYAIELALWVAHGLHERRGGDQDRGGLFSSAYGWSDVITPGRNVKLSTT